jgi:tetraacyldisaccharide 4'-kinase
VPGFTYVTGRSKGNAMNFGSSAISNFLNRVWYGASRWYVVLLPLSWLFARLTSIRRALYRSGVLRSVDVGVPVVVVGNIATGGTGKTPVTIWLANCLKDRGFRPGIASRGYGGIVGRAPLPVADDSDPRTVGDEPLLMARRAVCPVVVHPDRVAAAATLIEMGCDVIVADDGLQHYRLKRRFEIAVIDGARGFGNGRLLPAGPLREPVSRLHSVDQVMLQGGDAGVTERSITNAATRFELSVSGVHDLQSRITEPLEAFRGRSVHAVAGIGNPQRFFRLLESTGIRVIPHAYPDHASISRRALEFDDGLDVLMTEKDAVKMRGPNRPNWWYVTVDLTLGEPGDPEWLDSLAVALKRRPEQ